MTITCKACAHEVVLISEKWWHFNAGAGPSVECYYKPSKESDKCGCKKAGF